MAAVLKTLKDGAGADFDVNIQDALGRQSAATSPSHVLSNEDKAALDLLHTDLNTLAGFLDGVEALLTDIRTAAQDSVTPSPVIPATTAFALLPAPSTYRLVAAAASTNAANIKNAAGAVKGVQGYNARATPVWLRLYNKATAPVVGTDVPVKVLYLPPTAAFAFDFGTGVGFATGIGVGMSAAGGDADATAVAANDILALNVDYH